MPAESQQKQLDRTRPPKVQIKTGVKDYDAIPGVELPFVVGVLADLSGDNEVVDRKGRPLKITKRKFTHIDRDNFNDVLRDARPKVSFRVQDRLSGESDRSLNVSLEFQHLNDFHPEQVVRQVEPLRKLLEARTRLAALKAKMDGNDDLELKLQEILKNAEAREKVEAALGGPAGAGQPGAAGAGGPEAPETPEAGGAGGPSAPEGGAGGDD